MQRLIRSLALSVALLFVAAFPADAQWQVPSGSIPVGKGPGNTGFNSVTGSAGAGAKCLIDTVPPTFGACPAGAAGGSNNQVQYNNGGTLGGLTDVQLTTRCQPFTSVLLGCVPASGGGTLNFLRADGTFAVPPGTPGSMTVGVSTIASGTTMGVLYNNAGILGNTAAGTLDYHLTGNGATAPTFKGFLQPLTNAVTRTWQAKATDTINMRDFGVICDGATDNTTNIQNSINALPSTGGTIIAPPGLCFHTSTITTGSKVDVLIRGASVLAGTNTGSIFVYTGAGARAWDLRDSSGWVLEHISITAVNAAFAGTVVDAGGTIPGTTVSFYFKILESTLAAENGATATCLNLSESIEAVVDRVGFNSCNIGIRGQQTIAQSTVAKILSSQFFGTKTMPISDCGESWSIVGNTFEQLATTNNAGAISINSARPCKNIIIAGNWFGDANTTGTWVTLSANGASIYGNRIANGAVGVAMVGGTSYVIENNNMENTTAFTCASSPTGGRFGPNTYAVTTITTGGCVDFDYSGMETRIPATKTGNYSATVTDGDLIFNNAGGSSTLTLLAAGSFSGKSIRLKTTQAQTVVSASSNVVPLVGGAAGTAILAATAGKWATLRSDGTNWVILSGN